MYPKVYKEFKPDYHLKQYIKCYWQFEKDYAEGEFERVYPDSSYDVIYSRKATYTVADKPVPRLFVVGQSKKPADFYAVGTVKHWGVRFYPWGMQPFGNLDKIIGHDWQPADKVFNQNECQILEKLLAGTAIQTVTAALDNYFIKRLLSWHFDDITLRQAFVDLQARNGNVKVKDLADFCYVSRRQLGRKMNRATGMSPHQVSSSLRFEHVRDAIMHNPDIPLTFLAHESGYTDQSHLIKEFRQYTDITPTEYASTFQQAHYRMRNSDDVLFLQFEDEQA